MRRAPTKIDQQALERHKIKTMLEQDKIVRRLAAAPLEKLTGIERLLAALYRVSDLYDQKTSDQA